MSIQKKGEVKISKKGKEFAMIYEVPGNLTKDEMIAYAKKQHKERARKRP